MSKYLVVVLLTQSDASVICSDLYMCEYRSTHLEYSADMLC